LIGASARREPANPWITFALVAVGTFMIMLDTSTLTSVSHLSRGHSIRPLAGPSEWIIIAYLVTIASTLLTFGRLSGIVGRSRYGFPGWRLLPSARAFVARGNSLSLLIAARAFQGLGGRSCFQPASRLSPTASFDKRGFALGCNAV
jgi:MFS family permease